MIKCSQTFFLGGIGTNVQGLFKSKAGNLLLFWSCPKLGNGLVVRPRFEPWTFGMDFFYFNYTLRCYNRMKKELYCGHVGVGHNWKSTVPKCFANIYLLSLLNMNRFAVFIIAPLIRS